MSAARAEKTGLGEQVAQVLEAIRKRPSQQRQILTVFISTFFDAVKETIRSQGHITPFYLIMGDPICFGEPPVTEEALRRAKELNAAAVVTLEGFQSSNDIGDLIYHLSISAPCLGVMGWVLKVRLHEGKVVFQREFPYLFDSREKVKTLGEMVAEMEGD